MRNPFSGSDPYGLKKDMVFIPKKTKEELFIEDLQNSIIECSESDNFIMEIEKLNKEIR